MDLRLVVSLLIGAGFVLAALNLVLAYRDAKRQVRGAGEQIELSRVLAEAEKLELAARTEEQMAAADSAEAIWRKYEAMHVEHGIIRATYHNQALLPAMHAHRALSTIMKSSRSNLVWAGVGLLVSTGASIWGLWLT